MIYTILTEILQVMQYAPSTWLRTRTALIDLSGPKILVLRPRPLWKFGRGERGEKAGWLILCRKCYTSKQTTKDLLWDVAWMCHSQWIRRLTTVCVKLEWECMFLDTVWLKAIYEKSNSTEQDQQTKCFVLSCCLAFFSGACALWLLWALGIGKLWALSEAKLGH